MTRSTPRPRRAVSPRTLRLLAPLITFSANRRAYVLRLVGTSVGPVLVERPPTLKLMPQPTLAQPAEPLSPAEAQLASDPYASESRSAIASSE